MCAITGSFDTEKLRELVVLNSYRGQHSHSISYYNVETKEMIVHKNLGDIDLACINIPEGHYGVCHTQAPTTDAKDASSIHPATYVSGDCVNALWHNGIIKNNAVKRLQEQLKSDSVWDTQLLLQQVVERHVPSNIDGTFSCLWYKSIEYGKGDLVLFRNDISPMFIDDDMNISSTKFKGSQPTRANFMIQMDLVNRRLVDINVFETVENPYFFWD